MRAKVCTGMAQGACLLMAGEGGGISVRAGTWIIQQPVGMYWLSPCWQGRNGGTGGATRASEQLHMHCALWSSAGASVEMGTRTWCWSLLGSQQRCWCKEAAGACMHR